MDMQRRDLLKMITAATGLAMISAPSRAYVTLPMKTAEQTIFNKQQIAFIGEVAEVIVPKTDTPGAKAAGVGLSVAVLVSDCYSKAQQQHFMRGLADIEKRAQQTHGKPFVLLRADERLTLLSDLDEKAKVQNKMNGFTNEYLNRPTDVMPHYFTMIKQITLFSFFTSEVGAKKVLRYVAVPGRYDGDYPYEKGDRAWAP